jgi:hypothetical protein
MAHGVHPAMKAVKAPGREPALDRVLAEPERDELSSPDDTVLAARERRDSEVRVT